MTDFANLVVGVDSRQVKEGTAELDNLTASGKRAEDATTALAKAQAQAKQNTAGWRAELASGKITQEQFNAAVISQKTALQGVEKEYKDAAAALMKLQQVQMGAAGATAQQRAGLQQLGYQLGDVATMFSLGAKPAQIFGSQIGQITQAVQLMTGGTSRLAAFLGGPWGIAVSVATIALAPFIAKLFETEMAADSARGALEELAKARRDDLLDRTRIARAEQGLNELIERRAELEAKIASRPRDSNGRVLFSYKEQKELIAVNQEILAGREAITAAQEKEDKANARGAASVTGLIAAKAKLAGATTEADKAQALYNLRIAESEAAYAKSGKTAADQAKLLEDRTAAELALNKAQDAAKSSSASARASRSADAKAIREVETAYNQAMKAAKSYRENLDFETASIGKNAIELHAMRTAIAAAAAEKAALKAPTDAAAKALLEEAKAIREGEKAWESRTQQQASTDFENNVIKPLEDELYLLGLVGAERELAALGLEETAFKARAAADGIEDVNAAWEEYLRLQTAIINRESVLERETRTAEILNDQLREMIGLLGNLGAAGSVIGGLLGIVTGNVSAVGGPIGELLNIRTGITTDKNGNTIARTIGDELRDIFGGENSPFVKSMQSALQGAGTGLIASNALGFTGTGSQIGSAIGGALGETLGKEFLSKGLESIASGLGGAAGPLGAIAGGLLGGALGSLLSSTPRGSATIGNVGGTLGVTGTRGTSQARIAASEKSAGAIIDSLDALAAELGATIDPTSGNVSIGIRKGNYRVDTTGSGITKTKNGAVDFGQDAEAAALYAMQDLIRDGVLVGLRKGTENLLKNASDLEVGVQKALAFEGVFTELKALQDPLGSALDTLDKEFTRLRDIFEEAGATAEEYAQLEELLTIKRQDAIDDSIQRQIDDLSQRNDLEVELLRLLGREEEALAQAREYELAAMEDTLRPLQSLIYQLQDANAIIAQFSPLSDDLKAFRNELLGGGNDAASVGFLATRFRSTASLASQGDADALGQLRGTASDFLEAARDNASSALEYQRAVGEVLGAVDSGIFAADAQIEYAQLTIDAIDANRDELLQVRRELATTQQQIVENTSALRRLWERYDGDGLTIKSDQDTPIFIKTAPGDTVTTA